MDSIILRKTLSWIWKILVLYSVYTLLRGHNEPGGGFIGGLLLGLGIMLRGCVSPGNIDTQKLASSFPRALGIVLLSFLVIILLPAVYDGTVLQGMWTTIWVPIAGKFSSVLMFDIAVYLIVAASTLYAHGSLSHSQNLQRRAP